MSGAWSTEELRAEVVDLVDTAEHIAAEIPRFEVALERQLARTIEHYGHDETRWPGSSVHCVRTMRADLAARHARLADVIAVKAEYEMALRRREARYRTP